MYLYRTIDSTGDAVDFWNHEYNVWRRGRLPGPNVTA